MMAIIIVLNYVFFSSIFQRRLKLYLSFDFLAYPFVFCTIWKDLKVDYMHNACVLKYTHWLKLHKLPPSMKLGCLILKNMQKFWVYFIRVICNLIIAICTYSEFTRKNHRGFPSLLPQKLGTSLKVRSITCFQFPHKKDWLANNKNP